MLYYDKQLFKLVEKSQMREAIRRELEKRLPLLNNKLTSEERWTLAEVAVYSLKRFQPLEAPEKI